MITSHPQIEIPDELAEALLNVIAGQGDIEDIELVEEIFVPLLEKAIKVKHGTKKSEKKAENKKRDDLFKKVFDIDYETMERKVADMVEKRATDIPILDFAVPGPTCPWQWVQCIDTIGVYYELKQWFVCDHCPGSRTAGCNKKTS